MAQSRTGSMLDWKNEEEYWRTNYTDRPYVGSNRDFNYWRPAYRYGYDAAMKYQGRAWTDMEGDLRTGWDRLEERGQTTWEQIKAAVRDGWDRVMGNR